MFVRVVRRNGAVLGERLLSEHLEHRRTHLAQMLMACTTAAARHRLPGGGTYRRPPSGARRDGAKAP